MNNRSLLGFPGGPSYGVLTPSLLTGLVSYWKLEEASGARADVLGANSLTANAAPGNGTGKFGSGLSLTAASSQYLSHSGPIVARNTDRSFAFWLKPNSAMLTGRRGILSNGSANIDGSVNWQIEMNGVTNARLNVYQSGNGQSAAGPTTIVAGTWYHIVNLVTSNSCVLYLNGALEVSGGTATENNNALNFFVGVGYNGFCDGVIDELAIWSRVLTTAEITALYNGGAGKQYPFV